jgi:hypothetical protein
VGRLITWHLKIVGSIARSGRDTAISKKPSNLLFCSTNQPVFLNGIYTKTCNFHVSRLKKPQEDSAMETSESTTALPATSAEDLSPLEQDILEEYERLAENMKKV